MGEILYKQATAKEVIELLWNSKPGTKYYFTFDDCNEFDANDKPSGWYVIGMIEFDEEECIVIRYCGDSYICQSLACGEYDEIEDSIARFELFLKHHGNTDSVCLETEAQYE